MSEASPARPACRAFPWLTVLFLGTAGMLALWPAGRDLAIFDRAGIERGAAWRVFTGHFVHFGAAHLAWNALVIAVAGASLERAAPRSTRLFMLLAPAVVGGGLFVFEPNLQVYAGLSGIATALAALLGWKLAGASAADRWFGASLLVLIALKVALEFAGRRSFFATFEDGAIKVAPLAHAAGFVWAGVFAAAAAFGTRLRRGGMGARGVRRAAA